MVIDLWLGAGVRDGELALRIVHPLIFAAAVIVLWIRRHHPTRRFCTIAAVLTWIPFFPSLWLSEETAALLGRLGYSWQPFVGHKVLFFATAALFPGPAWVGTTTLAAFGLHAMLLWFHLGLDMPGAGVPIDEPWATIAYLGIAGVLFGYRIYHARTQVELAHARAQAKALKLSTDAFVAVHDLANSPLQVLELAIPLIRQRHVGDEAILDSAVHAVERLRTLRDQLPVARVTSTSPDPEALRRLRSLAAGEKITPPSRRPAPRRPAPRW
ncbi:MAG TPA: hypothetical protein VK034_15555 [Enhygromyxa sp.]|nr:hypothetical protein [Enhygromyxa sp.]